MLFNSIFRNVTITLLCITNKPTMLYAACPEKRSFHFGGWRGGGAGQGWGTWPPLSEFSGSAPARVLYTSIHLFMECFSTTSGESCRYCVVPENIHTPTTDGSLVFAPHPLGISLPEGHLWTPPPPRNFHFFLEGVLLKTNGICKFK